MSVQYSAMDVYQLLFELWLTYEEIKCLRELIQIDNQPHYVAERRKLYQKTDEISIYITNIWPSTLPPFLPLRLRYQNLKEAYNPMRYSKNAQFRLIYHYNRRNNDTARRACLRQVVYNIQYFIVITSFAWLQKQDGISLICLLDNFFDRLALCNSRKLEISNFFKNNYTFALEVTKEKQLPEFPEINLVLDRLEKRDPFFIPPTDTNQDFLYYHLL